MLGILKRLSQPVTFQPAEVCSHCSVAVLSLSLFLKQRKRSCLLLLDSVDQELRGKLSCDFCKLWLLCKISPHVPQCLRFCLIRLGTNFCVIHTMPSYLCLKLQGFSSKNHYTLSTHSLSFQFS